MEKLMPITRSCMAIITGQGDLCGHTVLVLFPHPDLPDIWMVGSQKALRKIPVPESDLMLVEGYVPKPRDIDEWLANEVTIKHYSGKWK